MIDPFFLVVKPCALPTKTSDTKYNFFRIKLDIFGCFKFQKWLETAGITGGSVREALSFQGIIQTKK